MSSELIISITGIAFAVLSLVLSALAAVFSYVYRDHESRLRNIEINYVSREELLRSVESVKEAVIASQQQSQTVISLLKELVQVEKDNNHGRAN